VGNLIHWKMAMARWLHTLILMSAMGAPVFTAVAYPSVSTHVVMEAADNPGRPSLEAPKALYAPPPRIPPDVLSPSPSDVVVFADVAGNGHVQNVSIAVSSRLRDLDRAALAAVRQWRFEPSPAGAQATPIRVRVSVVFARTPPRPSR